MITKTKWRRAVFALGLFRAFFGIISRPIILYILLYKPRGKNDNGNDQEGRTQKGEGLLKRKRRENAPVLVRDIDHSVIRHLLGDSFFERNIRDIARLESEVHASILDIFDTHPVFAKYPRLRGLARNKEFEEAQAKKRQAQNASKQR